MKVLQLTFLFFISCTPSNTGRQDTHNDISSECIASVIARDDELGTVRNHACEQISLAETIQNYVDKMGKVDFNDCPTAFKIAFEKHRQAWMEMIPLAKKYPDVRGEMHDIFNKIEKGDDKKEFKPLLKNIWDTWAEVEKAMK